MISVLLTRASVKRNDRGQPVLGLYPAKGNGIELALDEAMLHSLCRLLRQRNPDTVIDVLAPGWSLPVIGRMNEVREGIESPFAHGVFNWPGRHRLGKSLRDRAYDQAIVLPRSFKSALIPFHAGVSAWQNVVLREHRAMLACVRG